MKPLLAIPAIALSLSALAFPAGAQSKADQAAFTARLGGAHFRLDGENYLIIHRDGAPTRINFDDLLGFNWFNQHGELFAEITLVRDLWSKAAQTKPDYAKNGVLTEFLEINVETTTPSVEVRHIPGFVGDQPNRVMYYQEHNGPGSFPGEYYMMQLGDNDQAVTQVTELTDTTLKLRIKGAATLTGRRDRGESQVQFEAVINLKRTPFVRLAASSVFGEACDPTLYDKFAGAEYRSRIDCETKFERHVLHVMSDALQSVTAEFETKGWTVRDTFSTEPRTDRGFAMPRNEVRMGTGSAQSFQHRSGDDEAEYRQARVDEMRSKFAADLARQTKEFIAIQSDLQASDYVKIIMVANPRAVVADQIAHVKPLTVYPISGAGLAFGTNDVSEGDDGQAKLSPNKTFVYLGPVTQTTTRNGDGTSTLSVKPVFDPKVPSSAVQVVRITIECKPELAAIVLQKLDLSKLRALLYVGGNLR